jgi:hypothetical protein
MPRARASCPAHPGVMSFVIGALVVVSAAAHAQVYSVPTPSPQVTAASTEWLASGQPVVFAGSVYYRTGPTVFFDGNVMVRVGVYEGVPLYADATLEPYSIVFVPVGGNLLRPYERRREGPLAGTVGSRTPSFPIQRDAEAAAAANAAASLVTPAFAAAPAIVPETTQPIGTSGNVVSSLRAGTVAAPFEPKLIQSIPAPQSNGGVWIEFEGARYRSAGQAVPFATDRFIPVGSYHGFPVYRARDGAESDIYVPTVRDGALAPYRR